MSNVENWKKFAGTRFMVSDQGNVTLDGQPYKCPRTADGRQRLISVIGGVRMEEKLSRVVLTLFDRQPLPGEFACHGPLGCTDDNLDNIYWGSPTRNQRDRLRDGTDNRGESAPAAILKEADVVDMRRRAAAGEPTDRIAADYPVTYSAVRQAVNGSSWSHVGGAVPTKKRTKLIKPSVRRSNEDIRKIREERAAGATPSELADKYNADYSYICRVVSGKLRPKAGGPLTRSKYADRKLA